MNTYRYQAYEKSGKSLRGILRAENPEAARGLLKEKGLFLSQLREKESRARAGNAREHRLFLLRQLAALLAGGRAVDEALAMAAQLMPEGAARAAAGDLRARVRRGEPLSAALAAWPALFPPFYGAMIRAGEESGKLPLALARLADHEEREQALRSRVVSAAAYPAFVAVFSLGVVLFLFAYLIPTIRETTDDLGGALPWLTRFFFGVSEAVRAGWLPGLAALLAGLWFLARGLRTASGKRKIAAALLRTPGAGGIVRKMEAGRFCQALATLTGSGVELVRALETATGVFRNPVFGEWGTAAREKVVRGAPLSQAIAQSPLFPELVAAFARAGEESGSLSAQLETAGRMLEEQTQSELKKLTVFLEPVLILFVGVVVGAAVLAVVLPIAQLNTFIQ